MKLTTTVIGSLPRLHEDLNKAIELSVDLQVKIGIDIISDGEQRTDMISYLLNSFNGLEERNGKVYISSRLKPTVNVRESFKVVDLTTAMNYLKLKGYEKRIKVGITGPVTFGFSVATNGKGEYKSLVDKDLYIDAAIGINKVAKEIQSYGALVQIDEPGVSAGFLNPELIEEPINVATEGLDPKLTSLHACGRLRSKVLEHLLRLRNISTLSLEFAGSPENLNVVSSFSFENYNKKIGIGCMKVNILSKKELTKIEHSKEIISKISYFLGKKNISYIHPDCGLRRTSLEISTEILENLVNLAKNFEL